MWKLLIAEDEAIIRRGLKKSICWKDHSIEVVGEADDGEVALEMATELRPNIMFIDINMPFLNGIDLMQEIRKELPNTILIIITGYNEFSYAHQAVKLGALDYILKPVKKEELENTVKTAVNLLQSRTRTENLNLQVQGNKQLLKEKFLFNWCLDHYAEEEVKRQVQLLDIQFKGNIGLTIFKVAKEVDVSGSEQSLNEKLLNFAVKNIINDVLVNYPKAELFENENGHIILLISNIDMKTLLELNGIIINYSEQFLGKVVICEELVLDTYLDFPMAYRQLVKDMKSNQELAPIVVLTKSYIEQHYFDQSISLKQVANYVQVNPSYLSKQLNKEIGVSFVNYLRDVRINKALKLIKDPYLQINEIAEMVGYSTQHYFCNVFKKVVGISPTEYRNGVKSND